MDVRSININNMSGSVWTRQSRYLLSLLLVMGLLAVPVLGSTPGCPDCPDWTNFDSWWDRYHKDPVQEPSKPSHTEKAIPKRSEEENLSEMVYPEAELLVCPGDDLSGRTILDARSPQEYESGHLPGARNLCWRSIQSGGVLDPELAVEVLRKAGVNETDSIVVCGDTEGSAYLFWVLDYLGHQNLSRLDGDLSDLALVQNAPALNESTYTADIRAWLMVDPAALEAGQDTFEVKILDARSDFSDYARSHLRGAVPFSIDLIYDDAGAVKNAGELERIFEGKGVGGERTPLIYGTPEACSLYFALRLMGYQAAVLDGDWWLNSEDVVNSIS